MSFYHLMHFTFHKMKYWDKVRIKSWFYEGMEGIAYKPVSSTIILKDQPWFYEIKLDSLPENDNIVYQNEDNLEIIL